jgi:hypothetical protein
LTPYRLQSLNEFVPEAPLPDGADPASVLQLPSADIRRWATANFDVGHDANHAEEYVRALRDYAIARQRIITGDDALAEVGRSEELKTPGAQLLAAVMRINHVTRCMDAVTRHRVNALIWGSIALKIAA